MLFFYFFFPEKRDFTQLKTQAELGHAGTYQIIIFFVCFWFEFLYD